MNSSIVELFRLNNSTATLLVRLLPLVLFLLVVIKYLVFGGIHEFFGFYRSFLYMHGPVEPNVVFYFIISLYAVSYPLLSSVLIKVTRLLYIIVVSFFIFQIEYAFLTQIIVRYFGLVGSDEILHINFWLSSFLLAILAVALSVSSISKKVAYSVHGAIALSVLLSTYHSYAILVAFSSKG
ncbi:MAG: hypothetical protein ABW092_18165 [Candidatus Thiodiazotropha sp.]